MQTFFMVNPFDVIISHLDAIEKWQQENCRAATTQPIEIIGRDELCRRLNLTEPSIIRWERKGLIPSFRVGASVRYNWPAVVEALEKTKKTKP